MAHVEIPPRPHPFQPRTKTFGLCVLTLLTALAPTGCFRSLATNPNAGDSPRPPNNATPMERSLYAYLAEHHAEANYSLGEIKIPPAEDKDHFSFRVQYALREAEYERVEAIDVVRQMRPRLDITEREASSLGCYARKVRDKDEAGTISGRFERHGEMDHQPLYLITGWNDRPVAGREPGKILRYIDLNSRKLALDVDAPDFAETLRSLLGAYRAEQKLAHEDYAARANYGDRLRRAAFVALKGSRILQGEIPGDRLMLEITGAVDDSNPCPLVRFSRESSPENIATLRVSLEYGQSLAQGASVFSTTYEPNRPRDNWLQPFDGGSTGTPIVVMAGPGEASLTMANGSVVRLRGDVVPVRPTPSRASITSPRVSLPSLAPTAPATKTWSGLRSNTDRATVRDLLGNPVAETENKWIYPNGGWVSFQNGTTTWRAPNR